MTAWAVLVGVCLIAISAYCARLVDHWEKEIDRANRLIRREDGNR